MYSDKNIISIFTLTCFRISNFIINGGNDICLDDTLDNWDKMKQVATVTMHWNHVTKSGQCRSRDGLLKRYLFRKTNDIETNLGINQLINIYIWLFNKCFTNIKQQLQLFLDSLMKNFPFFYYRLLLRVYLAQCQLLSNKRRMNIIRKAKNQRYLHDIPLLIGHMVTGSPVVKNESGNGRSVIKTSLSFYNSHFSLELTAFHIKLLHLTRSKLG